MGFKYLDLGLALVNLAVVVYFVQSNRDTYFLMVSIFFVINKLKIEYKLMSFFMYE